MLEVQNMSVLVGGRRVVDGVNLTARRGELIVILGPRGAGKSTLLQALCGRLRPCAGRVTCDGRSLRTKEVEYYALQSSTGTPEIDMSEIAARECEVVLLDEQPEKLERHDPMRLLRFLDGLAGSGKIVVAALRDLHLAAYFANRVFLLARGRIVASGLPGAILTVERLHDSYGLPCSMLRSERA